MLLILLKVEILILMVLLVGQKLHILAHVLHVQKVNTLQAPHPVIFAQLVSMRLLELPLFVQNA